MPAHTIGACQKSPFRERHDVQKALTRRGFSSFAAAQKADATVVFAAIVRPDGWNGLRAAHQAWIDHHPAALHEVPTLMRRRKSSAAQQRSTIGGIR